MKTYDEFIHHYNQESESVKQSLYKNYLWVQKELLRKKAQYHRRRERYLANTPIEQRPKMGRPRKVPLPPPIPGPDPEKITLLSEVEALKKELAELKEFKASIPPPQKPNPAHFQFLSTPQTPHQYPTIISNSKTIEKRKSTQS
jgi:hypothetical protein